MSQLEARDIVFDGSTNPGRVRVTTRGGNLAIVVGETDADAKLLASILDDMRTEIARLRLSRHETRKSLRNVLRAVEDE